MRLLIIILSCLSIYGRSVDPSVFNAVKDLYSRYGNNQYMLHEKITQRSHALQAALIAHIVRAPEDVILGLLLHDIGQIASYSDLSNINYLHAQHDETGALWLKNHGFPIFVQDIARFHVIAKVVLCMENQHYFDALSSASQESYRIQINKYLSEPNQTTLNTFLNHPRKEDIMCARMCDDMAKMSSLTEDDFLPSFDSYYDMFLSVCTQKEIFPSWKNSIFDLYHLMLSNPIQFELQIKNSLVALSEPSFLESRR